MKRPSRSVTFWLLIASAACFVVQLIPGIGFLATSFGAFLAVGVLLNLAMIALFIEALLGRVRRWLIAIPVLFFGGYYAVLAYEQLRLPEIMNELGSTAENGGLRFDPAQHALDLRGMSVADEVLVRYDIDWIYNSQEGTRRTVGRTKTCEMISYITGVRDETNPIGRFTSVGGTFCFSYEDAAPPADTVISIEEQDSTPAVSGVIPAKIKTFVAKLRGVEVGRTSVVDAQVLSPIPLFAVGCGMPPESHGGFACGASFARNTVEVSPLLPRDAPRSTFGNGRESAQIAKLLSLTPRTPEEINAIRRIPPS